MIDIVARQPLTQLAEEEQMFRDSVREFAEAQIRPLVHPMDIEGKFDGDLLRRFFDMHLMGIEIPETLGGTGCSFFMSILAVEELSRVDASAGVVVDVQNTLVNNAIMRKAKIHLPTSTGFGQARRLCSIRGRIR